MKKYVKGKKIRRLENKTRDKCFKSLIPACPLSKCGQGNTKKLEIFVRRGATRDFIWMDS